VIANSSQIRRQAASTPTAMIGARILRKIVTRLVFARLALTQFGRTFGAGLLMICQSSVCVFHQLLRAIDSASRFTGAIVPSHLRKA
jgi:hypothetical protein